MAVEKGALKGLAITFLIVESFTLPIFTSGGRTQLTFFQWLKNHTVFGPAVEYVPLENYIREIQSAKEAEEESCRL